MKPGLRIWRPDLIDYINDGAPLINHFDLHNSRLTGDSVEIKFATGSAKNAI
jgi:hypothetical protein